MCKLSLRQVALGRYVAVSDVKFDFTLYGATQNENTNIVND